MVAKKKLSWEQWRIYDPTDNALKAKAASAILLLPIDYSFGLPLEDIIYAGRRLEEEARKIGVKHSVDITVAYLSSEEGGGNRGGYFKLTAKGLIW